MSSTTNDRLLGSVAPGGPARLLDEEEVDRMIAEREKDGDGDQEEETQ